MTFKQGCFGLLLVGASALAVGGEPVPRPRVALESPVISVAESNRSGLDGAVAEAVAAIVTPRPVDAPILIPRVVPYAEGAANEAIRTECEFPADVSRQLAEFSERRGVAVQLSDENLETVGGRVLLLKTSFVHAMGGGRFTGDKSARIRGELRENGRIIGDFHMQRNTAGAVSLTACGALERISRALASDVSVWLMAPQMGTRRGLK